MNPNHLIFLKINFFLQSRKWILAAKSVVTTMVSSFAGCVFATFHSLYETDGKVDILMVINGILGALVGITASCALVTTVHAGKKNVKCHSRLIRYENKFPFFSIYWCSWVLVSQYYCKATDLLKD